MIVLKVIGFIFLGLFLLSILLEILDAPFKIISKLETRWDDWLSNPKEEVEQRDATLKKHARITKRNPNIKI